MLLKLMHCSMPKPTKCLLVLKHRRYTLLFLVWLLTITLFSLLRLPDDDKVDWVSLPHFDKFVHCCFYFGVVVCCSFMLRELRPILKIRKVVLLSVCFAIAYGIFMEGLQQLMPYGRSAEIYDVLANSLGAVVAGLLIQKCHSLIGPLK